jgi:hypothetical protein
MLDQNGYRVLHVRLLNRKRMIVLMGLRKSQAKEVASLKSWVREVGRELCKWQEIDRFGSVYFDPVEIRKI